MNVDTKDNLPVDKPDYVLAKEELSDLWSKLRLKAELTCRCDRRLYEKNIPVSTVPVEVDENGWEHREFTLYINDDYKFPWKIGTGIKEFPKPEEIIAGSCREALSVATQTFKSWCCELGYDPDKRKALDTYLSTQDIFDTLSKVLSYSDIEKLSELACRL